MNGKLDMNQLRIKKKEMKIETQLVIIAFIIPFFCIGIIGLTIILISYLV